MIQASELRIGNFVKGGEVVWLHQIAIVLGLESGVNYQLHYTTLEPIPLTEEWLSNLGFVIHEEDSKRYFNPHTMFFELRNVTALENGFKIIAGYPEKTYFKGISIEIKYVHQLQNLYFALTQTELKLIK